MNPLFYSGGPGGIGLGDSSIPTRAFLSGGVPITSIIGSPLAGKWKYRCVGTPALVAVAGVAWTGSKTGAKAEHVDVAEEGGVWYLTVTDYQLGINGNRFWHGETLTMGANTVTLANPHEELQLA